MQLTVSSDVFHRFPGLRIAVVVAREIDNQTERPALEAAWQEAWARAGEVVATHGNAQSHPNVRAWREAMRANGVSPKEFPSSIEAILRRAGKGGSPFRINPLVDLYNTISLRHVVPVGAFDLGQIQGALELRLTREGDTFVSMDADAAIVVPPGEVAYAAGSTVLTRHFVWRQARAGLISSATRSALLVSEILPELGGDVPQHVIHDLSSAVEQYFGVTPTSSLVDESSPGFQHES